MQKVTACNFIVTHCNFVQQQGCMSELRDNIAGLTSHLQHQNSTKLHIFILYNYAKLYVYCSFVVVILIFFLLQPAMLRRMEAAVYHRIHILWLTRLARHHLEGRRWQYSAAVLLILLTLEMYCHQQHHCFHLNVPMSQVFIAGFQSVWRMTIFTQGQPLMLMVNTLLLAIYYISLS